MPHSLTSGIRLGPYEILAPIGAGAMGEVYRARDHKLDRDVALKVLPGALAGDRVALERFEREAKAVASLSHPNILAIHDFGCISAVPFAVMELLDGETLRERLARGPIGTTRAIAWATKIAEGAAAAHERGIVHRDLKPENVIITRDGQVKILDFGLARVAAPADPGDTTLAPDVDISMPGTVVGTAGYMAPEQVRGRPVDQRADIFALGCILYEMLAGRRAFPAPSAIETMASVLHNEPPALPLAERSIPPAVGRIVQHCLEKDPRHRFQSMRDVVFGLSNLDEPSASTFARPEEVTTGSSRRLRVAVTAVAAVAALAAAFWLGTRTRETTPAAAPRKVSFETVSFGKGIIDQARFTLDGQTVVFGAAWDGEPFRLFLTRPGTPETTALGLPDADLFDVSPSGDLAIGLGYRLAGWMGRATLARVPMLGAAPREIAHDVLAAEWSPDGSGLAVVRWAGARKRLEYPVGTVLYETGGWVSHPRFSADGGEIAFIDHPVDGDDRGNVALLDLRTGTRRALGAEWSGIQGLAWAPGGQEVYFSAYDGATPQSVYAVDLKGHTRQLLTAPTGLFLDDVAQDGRLLVASQTRTIQVLAQSARDAAPRDLSWLSYSFAVDISADGSKILLECAGDSCGETYTVFVRNIDGSPPVRLGAGSARALSPDGTKAAALVFGPRPSLVIYPLGAGQAREVDTGGRNVETVGWLPDGRGLVVLASEPGRRRRGWTVDLASGSWRSFTPEGVASWHWIPVSPAGTVAALLDRDGRPSLFPLDGGSPRPIEGMQAGDEAVRFSADGSELFLTRHAVPLQVFRLDLATGRRTLVRALPSPDPAGLQASFPAAVISADGRTVVGTYTRRLNKLYVVSGVR